MLDKSKTSNDTIIGVIAQRFLQSNSKPALSSKVGKEWKTITYCELADKVKHFSLGLRTLGIERGDRVAILSENRPEWAITDLAILASGAVVIPIYPTLPAVQIAYILQNSGARAIILSDQKQLKKLISIQDQISDLKHVIVIDSAEVKTPNHSFDEIITLGQSSVVQIKPTFDDLIASIKPSDLASLVYTSGTTGDPKGAMLSHGNLAAATKAAGLAYPIRIEDERFLSFLPLCHVFERVAYYLALRSGVHTFYAESIFKIQDNMTEVRPTIMNSVPRLFESIHERVVENVAKSPQKTQKTFHWALKIGQLHSKRVNSGSFINPILHIQHRIADKLVLSKVRARFGGSLWIFVSGGAPLTRETAEFFQGIGIPIAEAYGLTETTAATATNPYKRAKIGTVGKAFPGIEVKIASDGEILIKGQTIMQGYWKNPDATAEVIDSHGWFHSGDIGEIDKQGYIKITDRKKDILVLANGKKVAPQPIENHLKGSPYISEIVLLGDQSGTVSAIVVPAFDKLNHWAKESGVLVTEISELCRTNEAKKMIKAEIDQRSSHLAEFEKIRKIALLGHPLTIEAGELTPTLKVKRKVVKEKYGSLLN